MRRAIQIYGASPLPVRSLKLNWCKGTEYFMTVKTKIFFKLCTRSPRGLYFYSVNGYAMLLGVTVTVAWFGKNARAVKFVFCFPLNQDLNKQIYIALIQVYGMPVNSSQLRYLKKLKLDTIMSFLECVLFVLTVVECFILPVDNVIRQSPHLGHVSNELWIFSGDALEFQWFLQNMQFFTLWDSKVNTCRKTFRAILACENLVLGLLAK